MRARDRFNCRIPRERIQERADIARVDELRRTPPAIAAPRATDARPPRFARSTAIVLSCASFQQQFTFIRAQFTSMSLAGRMRIGQFLYRKACRSHR